MAYSRTQRPRCKIPGDPGVVCAYVPITTGATSVAVYVPWDNVKLVYAYTTYVSGDIVGSALDGGDCTITLTKSAAAAALGTITIASSGSAVGDVDEATFELYPDARNFTAADYITVGVDGHADTSAAILPGFNIYFYFEPDK